MEPLVNPGTSAPPSAATALPFAVTFFLVPGFSMMALSAAVEPLRSVNRIVGEQRYLWRIMAREAGPVAASNGLEVAATHGLIDPPRGDLTVVVASLDIDGYREPKVFEWLRRLRNGKRRIGAISTGPLILARAGLLDRHRATIHWEMQRRLAEEFPQVDLCTDLYCIDSDIITAAGGTASMDMMLALIAERDGRHVAADVAEQFLHGPMRSAGGMQRQDVRWRYQVTDRRLLAAISLMEDHVGDPIRIAQMAEVAGVSERQMERLFESAFGLSPSAFYMRLRLRAAQERLLHSTETLDEIAHSCGFSSAAHFSRAFKMCYGASPSAVRRRQRDDNVGNVQGIGDAT